MGGIRDRLPEAEMTKQEQAQQGRRRELKRVQPPDLVIRVPKVTKQWWPPEAEMEALISRISPTFSQRESRTIHPCENQNADVTIYILCRPLTSVRKLMFKDGLKII